MRLEEGSAPVEEDGRAGAAEREERGDGEVELERPADAHKVLVVRRDARHRATGFFLLCREAVAERAPPCLRTLLREERREAQDARLHMRHHKQRPAQLQDGNLTPMREEAHVDHIDQPLQWPLGVREQLDGAEELE